MNAEPLHFMLLGGIIVTIGFLLYFMLPPTGYTHNPFTGMFRGIFICIIAFGVLLIFVGALPYVDSFVIESGATNLTNYETAENTGNAAKIFIIGG